MIGCRFKPKTGDIAKRARNERITRRGRHEVWRYSGPCLSGRFVVGMVAIVRLRIPRGRIPRIPRIPRIHHKSAAKSVITRESGS
jgi:hypothetical protein